MADIVTEEFTPQIGLALSGGGLRAAVFHLGALGRLAKDGLLEHVTFISTVSGGSLAVGLTYALSDNRWPSSTSFLADVWPRARERLTRTDLEWAIAAEGLKRPWLIPGNRARLVSRALERHWRVHGTIKELSMSPRWSINATTYESGKVWRFTPARMGDYVVQYVASPDIPVADALAASAGYPFLIGPVIIQTHRYSWFRFVRGSITDTEPCTPRWSRLHLWDGGVYDNLGVEALFKPYRAETGERYREGMNFLIVSDASAGIEEQKPKGLYRRARRLLAVATDQVRSLRARSVVAHFREHPNSGAYLAMGNTGRFILDAARRLCACSDLSLDGSLSEQHVQCAARLPTRLSRLTKHQFDCAYRHGWEVAHYTLLAYCSDLFPACDLSEAPPVVGLATRC